MFFYTTGSDVSQTLKYMREHIPYRQPISQRRPLRMFNSEYPLPRRVIPSSFVPVRQSYREWDRYGFMFPQNQSSIAQRKPILPPSKESSKNSSKSLSKESSKDSSKKSSNNSSKSSSKESSKKSSKSSSKESSKSSSKESSKKSSKSSSKEKSKESSNDSSKSSSKETPETSSKTSEGSNAGTGLVSSSDTQASFPGTNIFSSTSSSSSKIFSSSFQSEKSEQKSPSIASFAPASSPQSPFSGFSRNASGGSKIETEKCTKATTKLEMLGESFFDSAEPRIKRSKNRRESERKAADVDRASFSSPFVSSLPTRVLDSDSLLSMNSTLNSSSISVPVKESLHTLRDSFLKMPVIPFFLKPDGQNPKFHEYLDRSQYFDSQFCEASEKDSEFNPQNIYFPSGHSYDELVSASENPLPPPDVTILCGEGSGSREFYAHKFILHIRSRILQKCPHHTERINDDEQHYLRIPNVSLDVMKSILSFCYTGSFCISKSLIFELYHFSKEFEIQGIAHSLAKDLLSTSDPIPFLSRCYEERERFPLVQSLLDSSLSYVAENFPPLSRGWVTRYSLSDEYRLIVTHEMLDDLLTHPKLQVRGLEGEGEVFLFVLACLACQCQIESLSDFPGQIPNIPNSDLVQLRLLLSRHIGNFRVLMLPSTLYMSHVYPLKFAPSSLHDIYSSLYLVYGDDRRRSLSNEEIDCLSERYSLHSSHFRTRRLREDHQALIAERKVQSPGSSSASSGTL